MARQQRHKIFVPNLTSQKTNRETSHFRLYNANTLVYSLELLHSIHEILKTSHQVATKLLSIL